MTCVQTAHQTWHAHSLPQICILSHIILGETGLQESDMEMKIIFNFIIISIICKLNMDNETHRTFDLSFGQEK